MNKIIELIPTILGEVLLEINFSTVKSDNNIVNCYKNIENKKFYETDNLEIELSQYTLPSKIYSSDELISVRAFILKLKQVNINSEKINIVIKLLSDLKANPESGEWLDSVLFENKYYKISIGTSDQEAMLQDALKNHWIPKRFIKFLKVNNKKYADRSFLSYIENGLEFNFPELIHKEELKIHFIIAENYNKGNHDISTNLAVSLTTYELEKILNKIKIAEL